MSTAGRGGRGTSRGSAMRSSESAGVASPSLPLYALRASPMCVGKRVGRSGATAALRPGRWHRLMASCRWPFPLMPVYNGGKSFTPPGDVLPSARKKLRQSIRIRSNDLRKLAVYSGVNRNRDRSESTAARQSPSRLMSIMRASLAKSSISWRG